MSPPSSPGEPCGGGLRPGAAVRRGGRPAALLPGALQLLGPGRRLGAAAAEVRAPGPQRAAGGHGEDQLLVIYT